MGISLQQFIANSFSTKKVKELINGWQDYLDKFELYPHVQTNDTLNAEFTLRTLRDALKLKEK